VALENWFLIQVKQNGYRLAERNLERQGVTCFHPMLRITERRGAQFKTVSRPLFPGYLFTAFDPKKVGWQKINNTLGVSRILSRSGRPEPVPTGLVETIMNQLDADGYFVKSSQLRRGDTVNIEAGPFSGMVAKVEKLEPQARVNLLVNLMGVNVRVKAHNNDLARPSIQDN